MNTQAVQDFPDSSLWLNADPTPLGDYRGQAVVLAFVNAASVWCAQRLAELAQWQTRYPGRLRTVVVQVPRFDRERDPTHVLQRLRSQGVNAPILLDRDWETWRRFGVRAWPTLVLLDAQGQEQQRIVGAAGDIDRALSVLCDGQSAPSSDDLPTYPEPRTALRFPAGLVATAERLYIADSGHHRVLECTHAGRVLRRFGTGTADLSDGGAGQAAFRRPQGLALAREALYVADTGNHA
ncbi:redoxin domain-containing protein, partial [Xanthomonas sp. Kuri4-2]